MDEDDNNVIAGEFPIVQAYSRTQLALAEGMERLCADASIPMDGALPLLVAWIVNAKTLGTITRAEFTGAFGKLKYDTPSLTSCPRLTAVDRVDTLEKVSLLASELNSLFFDCSISEKSARAPSHDICIRVVSYDGL